MEARPRKERPSIPQRYASKETASCLPTTTATTTPLSDAIADAYSDGLRDGESWSSCRRDTDDRDYAMARAERVEAKLAALETDAAKPEPEAGQ